MKRLAAVLSRLEDSLSLAFMRLVIRDAEFNFRICRDPFRRAQFADRLARLQRDLDDMQLHQRPICQTVAFQAQRGSTMRINAAAVIDSCIWVASVALLAGLFVAALAA